MTLRGLDWVGSVTLVDEILGWPDAKDGADIYALTSYLSRKTNQQLSITQVEESVRSLEARELVIYQGGKVWLKEPDRPERDLYPGLESQFGDSQFLNRIGIKGEEYVFQKTADGGVRDGRLTRPDFTLAAIRSWKFDPQRTLDVYSFEVKNRAGTSTASVYEAVAHGRMVHYPYLACPRSHLDSSLNEEMRTASAREGIGLILFDIVVFRVGEFRVEGLELIGKAERRYPDPALVERLCSRLT